MAGIMLTMAAVRNQVSRTSSLASAMFLVNTSRRLVVLR
jgi:hypothetical protein